MNKAKFRGTNSLVIEFELFKPKLNKNDVYKWQKHVDKPVYKAVNCKYFMWIIKFKI